MENRTKSSWFQATLSAAVCLSAACSDRDAVAGSHAAALLAECTDPTLIVESQTVSLWPPNHKFHEVTVDQCVSAVGACEGELQGEFIWASSDEPIDDIGDGHHMPDVGLGVDTGHVCVRSERQGPRDGRVYKLGVRITGADGETVDRECLVVVDHDQRGVRAVESDEAYRVEFDPAQAGVDCAGNPVETPGGEAGMGGGEAGAGGDEPDAGGGEAGAGGEAGEGGEAGASGEGGEGGGDTIPGGGSPF